MKIKIIVLFCAFAYNAHAQNIEEPKTIFGNKKSTIGYFINPNIQIGEIASSIAVLPSVGIGITFNNNINLGLVYKFIVTENTPFGEIDNRFYLDQKYGALKFEYSFFPAKAVHFNLPVEIGFGHTELDLKDSYESDTIHTPNTDAWFGYIEPSLAMEVNLLKYLKFNVGVGYRITSSFSSKSLSEKDMLGFVFSTGIKIGIF